MEKFFVFSSYIKHLFRSKSKFKVHSPFIYGLITKVFNADIPSSVSEKVSKTRENLCKNDTILKVVDFGAGSIANFQSKKTNFKTVKTIAKSALLKQKYANLLYNLIQFSKSQIIVELGTSLGMTTCMMALAAPNSKLYSMEGCESIASFAKKNLEQLGVKNASIKAGEFDSSIPEVFSNLNTVDFVFFDGNHRKEPTIDYFKRFLPYKHNNTIFVFDDIHWSKGMGEAWEYIKNHPDTVVTIDLFQMGIVFFRKELSPQHFVYRF